MKFLWLCLNKELGYTGQLIFAVHFFLAGLLLGEQPFKAFYRSFVLPRLGISFAPCRCATCIHVNNKQIGPAKYPVWLGIWYQNRMEVRLVIAASRGVSFLSSLDLDRGFATHNRSLLLR